MPDGKAHVQLTDASSLPRHLDAEDRRLDGMGAPLGTGAFRRAHLLCDLGARRSLHNYHTIRVRRVLTRTPVGWRPTQRLARLEHVVRRLTPRLDSEYCSPAEAREWVDRFTKDVYNRKRIRSLLGYDTPPEYEQQWQ